MSKCVGDVIIIDDDIGVLEVLEIYCENLNCFRNIIKARDGSEASKKLHNQEFGLILLDVNMPRKSGVDLLRELEDKSHPNQIKNVLIVSGEVDKMVLTVSVEKGVKNFLVKPFDEEQFRDKVKPILNLS